MVIKSLTAFLAGAAGWSLAEYVIHGQAGHVHARGGNIFAVEHVRHHATTHYFASSWLKVGAAAATSAVLAPLAGAVLGRRRGGAFTAGFVAMYVGYEVLHRRAHTHPPKTSYGRWLRKHHFYHHFHKPAANYGVTSPLWDKLCGSYEAPTVVCVPERHAMPWLIDDECGEVHADYAADYRLVRKRKRAREGDAAAGRDERAATAKPCQAA